MILYDNGGIIIGSTASLQKNKANGTMWLYTPKRWVEMYEHKPGQKFDVVFHKNGGISFMPIKKGKM